MSSKVCADGLTSWTSGIYNPCNAFVLLPSIVTIVNAVLILTQFFIYRGSPKKYNRLSLVDYMRIACFCICIVFTPIFILASQDDFDADGIVYCSLFACELILLIGHLIKEAKHRSSPSPTSLIVSATLLLQSFYVAFPGLKTVFWGNADPAIQDIPFLIIFFLIFFILLFFVGVNVTRQSSRVHAEGAEEALPVLEAGFLSRITFQWVTPLMVKGKQRVLQIKDLFDLKKNDEPTVLNARFDKYWSQELLLPVEKRSLTRALRRTCARTVFTSGLFKFLSDCLNFASPILFRQIIRAVKNTNPDLIGEGYLFTSLLFICNISSTVLLHQYFDRGLRTGMNFQSILTSSIFQKAMHIQSSSVNKTSSGDLLTYITVDTQKIQDVMDYVHVLWSSPLQIIFSVVYLYYFLRSSSLVGVFLIILALPLSRYLSLSVRELNKKVMAKKNERLKLTSETLTGVKVIKMYAWEEPLHTKLEKVRQEELNLLWKYRIRSCFVRIFWAVVPVLVSAATFFVYLVTGNTLVDDIAFTAQTVLNGLRFPITMFPFVITALIEARVSVKRIQKLLSVKELPVAVPLPAVQQGDVAVEIQNATFAWRNDGNVHSDNPSAPALSSSAQPSNERQSTSAAQSEDLEEATSPLLNNISFSAKQGELVAVIGKTGCGKSGFLQSLLGETVKKSGEVVIRGTPSYCPQISWIQNMTVKENILFFKPYDKTRYESIVKKCCLLPDFEQFAAGDATEIGENGINLSGGQKARISLARALYHNADIVLLDDILSAVDSHVSQSIFTDCLIPLSQDKCVVFVTHAIALLPRMDRIIYICDKSIAFDGTYQELIKRPEILEKISYQEKEEVKEGELEDELPAKKPSKVDVAKMNNTQGKLVEEEGMESDKVSGRIYLLYFKYCGGAKALAVIVALWMISIVCLVYNQLKMRDITNTKIPKEQIKIYYTILVVSLIQIFADIFFNLLGARSGQVGAKNFHNTLLHRVLKAPMRFFDTTPMGRIFNRFSKDIYTIDEKLNPSFMMIFSLLATIFSAIIMVLIVYPLLLILFIFIGVALYYIQDFFIVTSGQLRRLKSTLYSPLLSHCTETFSGTVMLRCYRMQALFKDIFDKKLNLNQRSTYISLLVNRWLAVRIETLASVIVAVFAFISVADRSPAKAASVGAALGLIMSISQPWNWLIRTLGDIETNVVSVERVVEYSELSMEKWEGDNNDIPPAWIANGEVKFDHVSVKYAPHLPNVLNNVSFTIRAGEKVGLVGRTGSGKSSLLICLLRLIELHEGKISVDGVNIGTIPLTLLREKISVIPQDPTLFAGTVRFNLDPFQMYSDAEITDALRRSHMLEKIQSLSGQLDYIVEQGGTNFSLGEKQLLCMARALLRKSKILLLDEATSAIDKSTDNGIQNTIQTEFADCTLITIAHRIDTIRDYHRILVLDHGEVMEYDSPYNLMKKTNSLFYALAVKAGLSLKDFTERIYEEKPAVVVSQEVQQRGRNYISTVVSMDAVDNNLSAALLEGSRED